MKPRAVALAALLVLAALACARLGVWQFSRYVAKQRSGAALRGALASPPLALERGAASLQGALGRRVVAEGEPDTAFTLLISDRWRGDSAGVECLAPLRLARGGEVLVDWGWLPSADGIHASPDWRSDAPQRLLALAQPLPRGARAQAWEALAGPPRALWSSRAVDEDTLVARGPAGIAPVLLVALPDPTAPARPSRAWPEAPDPAMHLSYTIQWALFCAAFAAGALLVLARARRAGRGGAARGT